MHTTIIRISFNRVNFSVLYFLYDSYMVDQAISVPIKENYITGVWYISVVLPLSPLFKPRHSLRSTPRKFRKYTAFNISTLISAPRYKTGTPFYSVTKTIPRPIRLSPLYFLPAIKQLLQYHYFLFHKAPATIRDRFLP